MSAAENKAVIDRFNVALNEGNLDVIDTISPQTFDTTPCRQARRGPGEFKAFLAAYHRAMPDLEFPSWTLIARTPGRHPYAGGGHFHERLMGPPCPTAKNIRSDRQRLAIR